MCACMLSHFSHVRLSETLWTITHQVPLSMGFSSKNAGVGCHSLLQGIFLIQGWNPHLLCPLDWQVDSLPLGHEGIPKLYMRYSEIHPGVSWVKTLDF